MYYFPHWGSNMAYVIGPERERVCVISWLKIELDRCCLHDTSPHVYDGDIASLMHYDNLISSQAFFEGHAITFLMGHILSVQ